MYSHILFLWFWKENNFNFSLQDAIPVIAWRGWRKQWIISARMISKLVIISFSRTLLHRVSYNPPDYARIVWIYFMGKEWILKCGIFNFKMTGHNILSFTHKSSCLMGACTWTAPLCWMLFIRSPNSSKIWGSHGSKYEDGCLLGCCAA
jgi:hypothetical protein